LDFIPTPDQQSYIVSLLPLGGIFGSFTAALLSNKIGRKWAILAGAKFFISSFILLIFEETLPLIYIARILQGIGCGIVLATLPIYIGEIASADCR
jgi:MFS transporter, SP family, galactose:H+ symporter